MSSIFTKIINGELPCYKVYEDEKVIAFLDIHPETPGHTLVVPKIEVDKIYELPDEDYEALMKVVKKLSVHMEKVLGARTMWKVIGTDVPHTHVHLTSEDPNWVYGQEVKMTDEEMAAMAKKLYLEA